MPRLLWHGPLLDADERFAVRPVENVDPAGLAGFGDGLAVLAADLDVEQHYRVGGVVVPDIVMHLLEMPAVFAGMDIQREHRRGEQVVSGAHVAREIGAGVARGEIHQAKFRVHGRRLPDRAAAIQVDLAVRVAGLRPGFAAELARTGHRIEGPCQRAIIGVVGLDAPPDAAFGAGKAGDHQAVVVERRAGERIAILPPLGLRFPRDLARCPVQGDQVRIQLPDEYHVLRQADAAAGPAAADHVDGLIQAGLVGPQGLAGIHTDGEYVVGAGDDIGHALVDDGLGFAGVLLGDARSAQTCSPYALELRDVVAVDRRQGRVALVV